MTKDSSVSVTSNDLTPSPSAMSEREEISVMDAVVEEQGEQEEQGESGTVVSGGGGSSDASWFSTKFGCCFGGPEAAAPGAVVDAP